MEALSGTKTHAQIASDYGISPDLVKDWKKQAKEMLGECFRRGGRKTEMENLLDDIETELHAGVIAGVVPVVMELFRQVETKSDYYLLEEDHLYLRSAVNQASSLLLSYMKHPSVTQEEKDQALHELNEIAESRFYADYGLFELAG